MPTPGSALRSSTAYSRSKTSGAAAPEHAKALYESFCRHLDGAGVPVATGVFAAEMEVTIINDGPVTIWMDTADIEKGKS